MKNRHPNTLLTEIHHVLAFAIVALLTFIAPNIASAQTNFTELTKLSYAAGNPTDNFGNSLAIDGDTIIVGANGSDIPYTQSTNPNNGAAFIYARQPNGAWMLQQALFPPASSNNFSFGNCVGISGDTAIVGAPGNEGVYVYVRSGGAWTFQQRITSGIPGGFGQQCAISGDSVIISARNEPGGAGAAYIYVRSGTVWTQQARLTRITGTTGIIGDVVTIDGDTAVLGVLADNSGGSVQVFVRSGTTWTPQQRITVTDGGLFGSSVAINGDTLVAGAPFANVPNAQGEGAAYIFTRSGGTWTQQQRLVSGDARPQARFGTSVGIEGNMAVVSSISNNPINGFFGGIGYVFQRSGTVWTRTQRLLPADNHGDFFGQSTDISGSNVAIGAISDKLGLNGEQGSAYVFTANPTSCTYSLNPTRSGLLPAAGGAGSFTVTTQAGCAWQATIQDRVTYVSTSSAGVGSGTVNFTVAPNSGKPRRAEISINGNQIYTISQTAGSSIQQGDFDQTFANAGVTTNKVFDTNAARSVKVQPDGKVVVVGGSFGGGTGAQVLRYNVDGSLDTTFDGDGIALVTAGIANQYFYDVALQPDGKIVAAGSAIFSGATLDVMVARFNSNGTLDTTFGTNGIAATTFGADATATSVSLLPDGKIVVGGTNSNPEFIVVRYNANGTLDTTFDGDGKVSVSGLAFGISDTAVQPDGKIVGIGLGSGTVFFRLNTNGSLDTTFDGDGRAIIPTSAMSQGRAITVQSDGKILGAGTSGSTTAVVRFNLDGSLDTTFAGDGIANDMTLATPYDIALQSNGKIVVSGSTVASNTYESDVIVFRFNANGSLDTTFSDDGKILTTEDPTFQDSYDRGNAVAIAPDGKIVVAGEYRFRSGQQDVMVLRFVGEGGTTVAARAKFDFDGDGKSDVSVFRPSNGSWYLLQSQNGFTGLQFGVATDKIVPADYDGDGKTDVAVFRSGVWYMQRSQLGFTGVSFGEATDIPMPADYDGDGKDDIAVFRPSNGTWYLLRSQLGFTGVSFGQTGDKPVAADYDGDGKADVAVFRAGTWFINRSSLGFIGVGFGEATDKPVVADYDGDGKADIAVFRPSNGSWYLNRSQLGFTGIQFGVSTDLPTPGDYDGDGKTDVAVYRASAGAWYLSRTTAGFTGVPFGAAEDLPAPNAFVR